MLHPVRRDGSVRRETQRWIGRHMVMEIGWTEPNEPRDGVWVQIKNESPVKFIAGRLTHDLPLTDTIIHD